jgi:hypothetical protein
MKKESMKTKGLIIAAVLGTLATLPAHGFGYWNNATYASRFRPDPKPAQPAFQIAVVAMSQDGTAINGARSATVAHKFGAPKPYATHSH